MAKPQQTPNLIRDLLARKATLQASVEQMIDGYNAELFTKFLEQKHPADLTRNRGLMFDLYATEFDSWRRELAQQVVNND